MVWGCVVPGGAWSRGGAWSQGGGGAWSRGVHDPRGVVVLGPGGYMVPGGAWSPRQLLLRAVRILLECILVKVL